MSSDSQIISEVIKACLADKGEDIELYELLGQTAYARLVDKYNGKRISIQIPEASKINDIYIMSFCWYYKEIKGLPCKEVKEKLGIDISSKKINENVKKINKILNIPQP